MKSIVLSEQAAHATHLFFEWLAIATGVQLYRLQRKRAGAGGILQAGHYGVLIGCILGAAIGNKLVYWLEVPHLWVGHWNDPAAWAGGQSIVGGLLGGLLGVELAKFCFGVKESTGDNFVVPLAVGTAIGRIGCFLAGLHDGTYGTATALPWGIDFGDGFGASLPGTPVNCRCVSRTIIPAIGRGLANGKQFDPEKLEAVSGFPGAYTQG